MKNLYFVIFSLTLLLCNVVHSENYEELEIPKEEIFYNSKEPGYFKISCNQLSQSSMVCNVEQLYFDEDSVGGCVISWDSKIYTFTLNKNNHTWNSVKDTNKECGLVIISTLNKNKDGHWSYKFRIHVRFPNEKTPFSKSSCSLFNSDDVEYTTKFSSLNLNCKSLTLLP